MKSVRFKAFIIGAFLLVTGSSVSPTPSREAESHEKPDMLSRVDRRPGILVPPSEFPTGDQAGIYHDLLETDPANTSFERDWQTREGF